MSKGHHAHRRRSYGRRQHDVRERTARRRFEPAGYEIDDEAGTRQDTFAFGEERHPALQLAMGG